MPEPEVLLRAGGGNPSVRADPPQARPVSGCDRPRIVRDVLDGQEGPRRLGSSEA